MTNEPMTEARLRALYGATHDLAAAKVIGQLDAHCRAIIANAPFLVLATTDGRQLDVSPKGDPAGFVHVEDDHHLILPDRPGNNRIDGLVNILNNPAVALLFLIPTVDETLRVNGLATIIDDPEVCARHAISGRAPKTVTQIRVTEVMTHCGKAPLRGGLWKPDTWPAERPVATLGAIMRDHTGLDAPTEQSWADQIYKETMY